MTAVIPELLTADELADRLRQSRRWVYRMVDEAGMPAIRIRRSLLFDVAAVASWLEQHSTTAITDHAD